MQIQNVPFNNVDWSSIEKTDHAGERGNATWRTKEVGNIRVRMVEYSKGYTADHWCSKGHVIHVLDGVLKTELQDGRVFVMEPGMSYIVADGESPHRSQTETGAKLFIVD
jgi:quercetin dioxygenase-like cupin family protein